MRTRSADLLVIAALAALAGRLSAQPATPPAPSMRGDGPAPTARPFNITRSDSALDAIYGGEPKRQICATNVAFGDADGKSLYVTACDDVYRIRMKVAGIMPGPQP